MLAEGRWKPSGWLGICTAGCLWTLLNDNDFDACVDQVVAQIATVAIITDDASDSTLDRGANKPLHVSIADSGVAELHRLRKNIGEATARGKLTDLSAPIFDPALPAVVPALVPTLPWNFRETDSIVELRRLLLSTRVDGTVKRIGFYGRGGIGKTVASSALLRDTDVRSCYDQILFLPLGQTPVMDKVRSLMHLQLTGLEPQVDWTDAQKEAAIRRATKGRRLLLYLDDIWDDAHSEALNLCDPQTGSALLVSTRIRGLCGHNAVEITAPTEEDAVQILMAAAGLSADHTPPPQAREIVRICVNLPLSLAISGKLIRDLAVGDDWSGIPDILTDELRGKTVNAERGVISASLAALGESKESDNIQKLFKLFALIPEDTAAPLEVLCLMFNAVYGPNLQDTPDSHTVGTRLHRQAMVTKQASKTPLLLLRKWLAVLLERSLVMGLIDRAQLHDLVLDFVISMYTEKELTLAHTRCVEAFRENRTVSVVGTRGWKAVNRSDATTVYVINEVEHHVANCFDKTSQASIDTLTRWVTDPILDCIPFACARVLGEDRLVEAVEVAEAAEEWFWMGCRLEMLAYFRREVLAMIDEELAQIRIKAMRALCNIEVGADGKCSNGRCTDEERWMLVLLIGQNFVMVGGPMLVPDEMGDIKPIFKKATEQPVSDKYPLARYCLLRLMDGIFDTWQAADVGQTAQILWESLNDVRRMLEFDDQDTVDEVVLLLAGFEFAYVGISVYHEAFDWEQYPFDVSAAATKLYNYDLHHNVLQDSGQDFCASTVIGIAHGLHVGGLSTIKEGLQLQHDSIVQLAREPDQKNENLVYFWLSGGFTAWVTYAFGRGQTRASMFDALGMTWTDGGNFADRLNSEPFTRARGDSEPGDMYFNSAESAEFTIRAGHLLVTECKHVPKETIVAWLPSPEQLYAWINVNKNKACIGLLFFEPWLLAALVAEIVGAADQALEYCGRLIMATDSEPIDQRTRRGPHRYTLPSGEQLRSRIHSHGADPKCTSQVCVPQAALQCPLMIRKRRIAVVVFITELILLRVSDSSKVYSGTCSRDTGPACRSSSVT
jgi:hypothetical protein